MYMRVTRGRLDPTQARAYARAVDEQVLPALRQLPGFWGAYGGVEPATGVVCAVTLWDTRMQAAAAGAVRPMLEGLGVRFGEAEVFEVHVHA